MNADETTGLRTNERHRRAIGLPAQVRTNVQDQLLGVHWTYILRNHHDLHNMAAGSEEGS